MRNLAAVFVFTSIAGLSAPALADRAPPRPAPEQTEKDDAEKDDAKKDEAKKDETEKADAKKDDSGSCSVAQEDDAMLGFAALVLLTSGLALRRRSRPWL